MTFPDSKAGQMWRRSIERTRTAEKELPKVIRWKKYIPIVQCREQNSLGHSYTISLLGTHFIKLIKPYAKIDAELLLTALLIHDFGESARARIGEDVRWRHKTCQSDLSEYEFFMDHFSTAKPEVLREYQTAFLLQFAEKGRDISCFPEEARRAINEIIDKYPNEIAAFDALEKWDYVLYGLANYEETGNELLLMEVLDSHAEVFEETAEKLPGFREEIWTDDIRDWCERFRVEHEFLMPEVNERIRS